MRVSTIITLFVCGLFVIACSGQQSLNAAVFQMRLVQDSSTTETEQLTILHSLADARRTAPETLNVQKKVLLDETSVRSATVQTQNPRNAPVIEVVFTDKGQKLFANITRQSRGKRLAFVVDGKLLAAPKIEMEITGDRALISGRFSAQDASELAAKINNAVKK